MKKRDLTIRIMAVMLAIIVAGQACTVPAYAAKPNTPKEEVVYSNLDNNGLVRDITVVNIFEPEGEVIDYGNYSSVRNMTSTDPINVNEDEISIKTSDKSLYYEGVMDQKELPWNISIKYRLDGNNVMGDELAGKSGHLVITMNVSKNKQLDKVSKGGKVADYYENMALQASVTLDSNKCKNIESDNATFANVGKDKQLTYTILPDKGANIRIDTDVTDFEMEGISINGISLNLDIAVDKSRFEKDEQELKDAGVELDDGVQELKDGVDDEMCGAVNKLKDASSDLQEAAGKLNDGSSKLKEGSSDLKDGTGKLKDGVNDLSDGIYQIYNGTLELENGTQTAAGYTPALKNATADIKQLALAGAQAAGHGDPSATAAYIAQVNNYYAMLDDYFNGITGLGSGATSLRSGVKELFDGTYPLYNAAVELDEGAKEFDEKIEELQKGCNDLKDGVDDLDNGVHELDDGVHDLKDGIQKLKDGTKELRDKTSDIDVKIDDKVDEMIGEISGTDKVVSFTSTKNTNIESVQFVIKTAGIEIKENEKAEEAPEPEKTFWQKLFELFGGIVAHAATTSDEPKDYTIGSCWWETDGNTIMANWDKAEDKTKYSVMLYRTLTISSKYSVGSLIETSACKHDFAKAIAQKGPGYYYFVVWPQKLGRSASVTSEGLFVDYESYKKVSDTYGTSASTTAEDKTEKIALTEPQNIYLDKDNKLHWDSVEHADRYRIVVFKDDEIAVYKKPQNCVYDLSEYIDEEPMCTVSVRVSALSNYPQYKESTAATIDDLSEFACGWRKIKNDWYYYYDANDPAIGWYEDVDGNWYFFDENNKMKTGNLEIDGITYFMNDGSYAGYPLGALIQE